MFINGIIAVFTPFPSRGPWQGMMGMFYICTYPWYLVEEPEKQCTGLSAEHPQTPKLLVHKARALCHSSPSLLWQEFLFVRKADLIENLVAPYSFCHGSVPSGAKRQSWAVWEHCFCLPCSLGSWRNSADLCTARSLTPFFCCCFHLPVIFQHVDAVSSWFSILLLQ